MLDGVEVERSEDLNFILDDGDVVPAINISVALMELNEEAEIKCDPRHAYGPKGK